MAETPADGSATPTIDDDPAAAVPAFALDALDEHDRAAVEAWLATDESRQHELATYQTVVAQLPLLAEEREPPAGLRARLLDAAATDLHTPAVPPTPPPAPAPPIQLAWYRRPAPWAAVAAVLLLTTPSLGVWAAALRGQLQDQQQMTQLLQGQLADSQTQIADLRAQPRVTVYAVNGTSDAPNATGQVVYVPQHQTAYLNVANLPPTPADRAYQVWFIQDGKPVSAGLLPTAPNQAAARLPADLSRYQAIAVSLEPAGGSLQPTGPIVVMGPLTAGNA